MKSLFLFIPVALALFLSTHGSLASPAAVFFNSLIIVDERDVVLNDTIQFPSLNVENLDVVSDAPQIAAQVSVPQPAPEETQTRQKKKVPEPLPCAADAPVFENLSRYFYLGLKKHIVEQRVPLTLVANQVPSYAKPLTLLVSIGKIHFKSYEPDKKGYTFLPVTMEIRGEVKDKTSDVTLFTFADSVETALPTENSQPQDVLNQAASLLMKDLASYLKTLF